MDVNEQLTVSDDDSQDVDNIVTKMITKILLSGRFHVTWPLDVSRDQTQRKNEDKQNHNKHDPNLQ